MFDFLHMGVSKNKGTPKTSHLNRVWNHYKPSILGYPYFWKHPYSPELEIRVGVIFCSQELVGVHSCKLPVWCPGQGEQLPCIR